MEAKVVFIARTKEEIDIFGGDVYIDIDGKNIGILSNENITINLPIGVHKVKMYKSHEFGTMIGFAEVEVDLKEGNGLCFRYIPPMIINQPGHIIVSDFISYEQINKMLIDKSAQLKKEKIQSDNQKKEIENSAKNNTFWIVLIVFIIPAIFWIIYEVCILDMIY